MGFEHCACLYSPCDAEYKRPYSELVWIMEFAHSWHLCGIIVSHEVNKLFVDSSFSTNVTPSKEKHLNFFCLCSCFFWQDLFWWKFQDCVIGFRLRFFIGIQWDGFVWCSSKLLIFIEELHEPSTIFSYLITIFSYRIDFIYGCSLNPFNVAPHNIHCFLTNKATLPFKRS